MSSMTLKEQLEALAVRPTTSSSSTPKVKKQKEHAKPKPAWLPQAQYGVELLKAYFPSCFREATEIKPLKIGIKQDLVKYLSTRTDIVINDKACMVSSLSYYVSAISYHKNMLEGVDRIDLDGHSAGKVTA